MSKSSKKTSDGYATQFKPAIQLGSPSLAQWGDFFYAKNLQETYDPASGDHLVRLARGSSDSAEMSAVVQLTTRVADFRPTFRQVEVVGKKEFDAICVDGGFGQNGVFVYLSQTVDVGGGQSEVQINTRFLPFAIFSDLISGTGSNGAIEIKLPETDIAKLNVTLQASAAEEPEFRTFKTEVLFENLPTAQQQTIENNLNFAAASISAFIGFQILSAKGQWPPVASSAKTEAVDFPQISPVVKKVLAAILVTVGSVVTVVGVATEDPALQATGEGLLGAVAIASYWGDVFAPAPAPAVALPAPENAV